MDRRSFLTGLGALVLLPSDPPDPVDRPRRALTLVRRPVHANLVGVDGIRSDPVVFDGARPRPEFQWGDWIPIPPLDFVSPRAGTWTHVELTDGRRTEIVELLPSTSSWAGDVHRVAGLVWRG